MRRTILRTILVFSAAYTVWGQPAFDVASVKPSVRNKGLAEMHGDGGSGNMLDNGPKTTPVSLSLHGSSLRDCIAWAYKVETYQVSGSDSLNGQPYDIDAKTAEPVSVDQLRAMLQTLLTDRFKLAVHRENKELQVFELTVAKGGPKVRKSENGDAPSLRGQKMALEARNVPLPKFCELLSQPMQRPVIDKTGLQGGYDFSLDLTKYVDLEHMDGKDPSSRPDPVTIIANAVKNELGLNLESRKAMSELLIVDHAEKEPTGN
jgi:uncharacterized protein (TIGR03435 family)